MALTQMEKHLVLGLKLFGLTEEDQAAIFLVLQKEEQQVALMEYMAKHLNADGSELLRETLRILDDTENTL